MSILPGQKDSADGIPVVRHLQEYLTLLGYAVSLDGEMGPATTAAYRAWALSFYGTPMSNPEVGVIVPDADIDRMRKLLGLERCTAPSLDDLAWGPVPPQFRSQDLVGDFGGTAMAVARLHMKYRPREVGADNFGPRVRLYMGGTEGLPWCAGFASTIWKQAEILSGIKRLIDYSWSCTRLAEQAQNRGAFRRGEDLGDTPIPGGSLFVRRKKKKDGTYFDAYWEHTGVVVEDLPAENVVKTIEGNTNEGGSREGFIVCQHILRRDNRDYIFAR